MRFGSCFAGIGGFDLGLEAAGFVPVWQVEVNEFCRAVLARHWPRVARYADIREVPMLDPVDLICGGFPCQDVSVAGKQEGLEGERSRLWYDMFEIIKRVRPRWVVIENSPALRTRGADTVVGGLEGVGYSCWPVVVGAWAVGARHRRDRAWVIGRLDYAVLERSTDADSWFRPRRKSFELASELADAGITGCEERGVERILDPIGPAQRDHVNGRNGQVADASQCGLRSGDDAEEGQPSESIRVEHPESSGLEGKRKRLPRRWPAGPVEPQQLWEPTRTLEPSVGSRAYGLSARLAERKRKLEIEALGAAVVPQVAEAIGRAIAAVEAAEKADAADRSADLEELFG